MNNLIALEHPRNTPPQTVALALILVFAFAQGVFRAMIVPVWGNHDEPGHMEYILFIAKHLTLPDSTSIDYQLRQRIADTYNLRDCSADIAGSVDGCLGFHQLDEAPGYYIIQAAFQRVFAPATIAQQLILARIVSVLMLLLVVLLAYLATDTLFPDHRLFAVGVSATIVALPGYANIMSIANNDVMASLSGSLLLLMVVLLIKSGITFLDLLTVPFAMLMCALSKTTAQILLPVALVAIWLSIKFAKPVYYGALLIPLLAVVVWIVDARGSAGWQKAQSDIVDRTATDAPFGRYAFNLPPTYSSWQVFSKAEAASLSGKTVTIGAWIRAPDGPTAAAPLHLDDGWYRFSPQPVSLDSEWRFFAWATVISEDAPFIRVLLVAPDNARLQYDGVVVVFGDFAGVGPPQWAGADARAAVWAGHPLNNLVRNGSAERGWPLIDEQIDARLPISLNPHLESTYSIWHSGAFSVKIIKTLFLTFWGSFGWGVLSFEPPLTYLLYAIAALSGLGLLKATGFGSLKKPAVSAVQVKILVVYALIILVSFSAAFIRTTPPTLYGIDPVDTHARYMFPAIIPIMTLLLFGLAIWLPRWLRRYSLAVFILFLYLAHIHSIFSVQLAYRQIGI